MELGHDDWVFLRQLAGELDGASSTARGDYVHLDIRYVDSVVARLREVTDKPHSAATGKTQAQRREKRG